MVAVSDPVMLSSFTTLRLGGPAPELVVADTTEDLIGAVASIDARGEPLLLIAGGSNLVIADRGVDHPVVRITTTGVTAAADGEDLIITVAAGEDWDRVVGMFTAQGWSGLEFLSGIPGSTGATPVQNVGAYGADVADVLVDVEVWDRAQRERRTLSAAELRLGYRSSILRGTDRAVVLAVRMRLTRSPAPVRFGELANTLGVSPGDRVPPGRVREAVLALRRGKGMVLDPYDADTRSVGSFFTNPLLSPAQFADARSMILARLGDSASFPHYPAGDSVKLSAAWLIEHAGFQRGFALPGARAAISSKHTLALTNRGGTTAELLDLARRVRDGVRDAFGVELHAEPILVGVQI